MKRSFIFFFVLIFVFPICLFAQTGASGVRDYVGLINQSYHPGIVAYFEKVKKEFTKRNETDLVKVIDIILSGGFGSGFLYSDGRGNFYVITNNHVVTQAHELSITFEKTDGTKTKLENLKIIATDVDADLAILSIPAGQRPLVTQGLSFITRDAEEGEEVFSAGFPGLGITPIWQFGNGRVSNASAKFPKSLNDDTQMGPFIQHTAQIDGGNSGGPLLVAQRTAPSGYAVVGINTLSGVNRQAANYAIPISTVQPFINNALNPRPETYKQALDDRLAKFVEGVSGNKSVYPHISEFLSAVCIGENAEYAFEEMLEKASRQVVRDFVDKGREDFIGAMAVAIAWTIENSIKNNKSTFTTTLKEVTGEGEEYTVVLNINNKDINTVWIREYGNWRIKSFGTVASGDTSLIDRRQTKRDSVASMRMSSPFRVEAGYAFLFDRAPAALYLSLDASLYGVNVYFAEDLWSVQVYFGAHFPIPIGSIGLMPFIRLGGGIIKDETVKKDFMDFPFDFSIMVQGGLKVTTSVVPGLYAGVGYQYNLPFPSKLPFEMALTISVGYSF
ncbi:MAG: trypsin-like peptidase domain-containing protein [Treponema sp.]|nr:trypsin-like peptidase domain-containing protein [Treponema sp.]MCL2251184.1 trypsin-like peptidase domain-containing protein [Treponema sp.]